MGGDERTKLWEQRVKDFQSSGLSARVWCKANGVGVSTFYKWKKLLSNSVSAKASVAPAQTKPGWVQLVPTDTKIIEPNVEPNAVAGSNATTGRSNPSLLIKIGDMTIEVHRGFDPALLTPVIGVLRSC